MLTMGERDAGAGGHGGERGDAGNHFEGNAGLGELFRFFATPTEHIGIAAFEPNHGFSSHRTVAEDLMDLVLGERVIPPTLSGVDDFSAGRGESEENGIDQRVVHDDVRAAQDFGATEGEETGIARTGPDEVHTTRFRFRHGRRVTGSPGVGEGRRTEDRGRRCSLARRPVVGLGGR
jgi:hypothetical protein